jgi:hypothetical protein
LFRWIALLTSGTGASIPSRKACPDLCRVTEKKTTLDPARAGSAGVDFRLVVCRFRLGVKNGFVRPRAISFTFGFGRQA